MRKSVLITATLLLFLTPFIQAADWSTSIAGRAPISTRPVICQDPLGYLHIAWTSDDNTGEKLRYATNQAGQWGYQTQIAGSATDVAYNPAITADSHGFAYVVARFYSSWYQIKYATNFEIAGNSWNLITRMGDAHYHESSLEIASNNSVHIFAQEDNSGSNVYYQNHTADDVVIPGGTSQFFATAIDLNDRLHFLGSHADNIWYTYYDNGWSTPDPIDQLAVATYHPAITVDLNGGLHVVFASANGIYYLNNLSGTWSVPEPTGGSGIFPNIVVDENGHAHIAYYTQVENGAIYYLNNISGSWTTPEYISTINTDVSPATEDAAHVESKIALDLKTSTVNIVYVQNDSLVTVAQTNDYELRSFHTTDISTVLVSDLSAPGIDTLGSDVQGTIDLLQFTISDIAGDGVPTRIRELLIQRGPGCSPTLCFNDIFQSVTFNASDGSTAEGTIYGSRIIVGTPESIWKSIPEGGSLSFTVRGTFNTTMSTVEHKSMQLKINGLYDVIIDTTGSRFAYTCENICSNTLVFEALDFSGAGTAADPYLIATLENLRTLTENNSYWDKHFRQMADIDAAATSGWNNGAGFLPIASLASFSGSYDGNGHVIDGLTINRSGTGYVGFFSSLNGATIENLGLTDMMVAGGDETGGLAGILTSSTIANCYVAGTVSGNMFVGGLIGFNQYGTVSQSYSSASVNGSSLRIGGLLGYNFTGVISDCYSSGRVSRTSGASQDIAGFCGYNYASTIEHSYSISEVIYNGGNPTDKGFVGQEVGTNQYSGNFFDSDVSHQTTGLGATGRTSSEMKTQVTFTAAGWDFTTPIWIINGSLNNGYPYFEWQAFDTSNTAPLAENLAVVTDEDEAVAITLSATDAEGDSVTFSLTTNPQHGTLSGNLPFLTYTTVADWYGNDAFTYQASDGSLESLPATVTITVNPVNDPPVFTSLPDTTATENEAYSYQIEVSDIDSETLAVSAPTLPDWLTLNTPANTLTGLPDNDAVGLHQVMLSVSDGTAETNQAFTIRVSDVNNSPGDFELFAPVNNTTLILTPQNLADTLWFAWTAAVDADHDSLDYLFNLSPDLTLLSGYLQFESAQIAFMEHADLVAALLDSAGTVSGSWSVAVYDGVDTVTAANGPFFLTIDATALNIRSQVMLPADYVLEQNYPNPFNPSTTVRYALPRQADVTLIIYDVEGRIIVKLVQVQRSAGWHTAVWNGLNAAGNPVTTGVYLARIEAGDFRDVIKMVYLK